MGVQKNLPISVPYRLLTQVGSNPRSRAYHAKAPTTDLSGRTRDMLNGLKNQVTPKLKSSLGDFSDGVEAAVATNFLYFL